MFTVPIILLTSLLYLGSIGIQLSPEDQQKLEERYSLPARDTLQPKYSLDPAERDALLEHLSKVQRAYEVMQFRAKMEHMGIDSAYIAMNHWLITQDSPKNIQERRLLDDIKVPILPEHVYWLMNIGHDAYRKEPKDWYVIDTVLRIGLHIERQPWLERLACDVLSMHISEETDRSSVQTITSALIYLRNHWTYDSAQIIASVFTLQYQPIDREVLPVLENMPRPEKLESILSESSLSAIRTYIYPERAKKILTLIDSMLLSEDRQLINDTYQRLEDYKRMMAVYYPDDPYWTTPAISE